jgi:hypothetical protein
MPLLIDIVHKEEIEILAQTWLNAWVVFRVLCVHTVDEPVP